MKQILEKLPETAALEATFDLLRYENAAQQARIATLEAELEAMREGLADKDRLLESQQEFIDLLNAEIHALRETG
ncbi:hypothetical protein [Amaricoccus macauensis]|uniref:hypothetical protein n=1 Tax=Amaricoccus macauensis TaxID=57001 RepID=UPI003C7E17CE